MISLLSIKPQPAPNPILLIALNLLSIIVLAPSTNKKSFEGKNYRMICGSYIQQLDIPLRSFEHITKRTSPSINYPGVSLLDGRQNFRELILQNTPALVVLQDSHP